MTKHTSVFAILGIGLLTIAGCQSNKAPSNVPVEYFQGVSLDRNDIGVREKTEYLEVNLDPRDSQLRLGEVAKIRGFLADYNASGHGPLVMSMPKGAINPQLAVGAAVEARELAWEAGIEYEEILGAAYDARNRRNAPLIMAFKSYEAVAPDCPQLGEIDFSNAISNSDLPTLGCAVRTNMAAMIAEPADLFGDRVLDARDLERRNVQLEAWRQGATTAAARDATESGAISSAIN
ncbi:MAG: CpaD family pilus assembly lipoprotein [Henriciella sp.]|nr:CpaD family pilus assembly lipoprotein [Henriciella sp.]